MIVDVSNHIIFQDDHHLLFKIEGDEIFAMFVLSIFYVKNINLDDLRWWRLSNLNDPTYYLNLYIENYDRVIIIKN